MNLGWRKISDLLRGFVTAKDKTALLETIAKIDKNKRSKIIKVTPRFGAAGEDQNVVIVHYDYGGKMICELKVQLESYREPLHYYSNRHIS